MAAELAQRTQQERRLLQEAAERARVAAEERRKCAARPLKQHDAPQQSPDVFRGFTAPTMMFRSRQSSVYFRGPEALKTTCLRLLIVMPSIFRRCRHSCAPFNLDVTFW